MKKVISILFFLVALISSCKNSDMTKADNAELKKEIIAGRATYTIELISAENFAMRGMDDPSGFDSVALKKRMDEVKGHVFFLIHIQTKQSGSVQESMIEKGQAERMVSYYHEAAASDLSLVQGTSALKPVVYLFENNYGLTPYNTIVAGFELDEIATDLKLVFNDRYYQNPLIQATFAKDVLTQFPDLLLNKS